MEDESGLAFLRPETAQGIFINYKNVQTTSRKKIPFGIGQVGKSFRNEITPGNFIFRTREFEQMEMEFFVKPGTDEEWFQYWIDHRLAWWTGLGINPDNLRKYEHPKEKLSHYSKGTVDIEYRFGFIGSEWGELEGIANRTDFDLSSHQKASGVDLTYLDQESGERYTPYVIEPAAGADRGALVFLLDAYSEDEAPDAKGKLEKRTVLRLDPRLAPVKVAVLPLSRNADLSPKAKDIAADAPQAVEHRLRRRPGDRPPLPPPGRDRHAVLRHRRLRHPGRPGRDGQGPRHHGPGAHRHRRPRRLPVRPPPAVLARPMAKSATISGALRQLCLPGTTPRTPRGPRPAARSQKAPSRRRAAARAARFLSDVYAGCGWLTACANAATAGWPLVPLR